jgi:hypothetical protein
MFLPLRFTGVAVSKVGGLQIGRKVEISVNRANCIESVCPARNSPVDVLLADVLDVY